MIEDAQRSRDASGRFASEHGAEVQARVRVDYELSPLTVEEISERHKVSETTIYEWARDGCWVRRRPRRIDPTDLVSRMLGLLDRQMTELETAMNNGATEVAMLSKLVTTLDKVLLLKERIVRDKPRSSKRVDELRAKIAERIGELNRA
jgi:hypothetical protein